MALANFNPLTPMPGTALYDRLKANGDLLRPNWWIDRDYRYGDAIFTPKNMSALELRDGPMRARRAFYSWRSIAARVMRGVSLWRRPMSIALMILANYISRREILRKQAQALSPAVLRPQERPAA